MKILISTLEQFQAFIARETILRSDTIVRIRSTETPKVYPCVVAYEVIDNCLIHSFVYKEDFVETPKSEEERLNQFANHLLKELGSIFDLNRAKEHLTKMVMEATTNEQRAIWQKHLEYVISLMKKN